MENSPVLRWVIRVVGQEDLMFTLHESREDAINQCSQLNRKFNDRFYVDTYNPTEEQYEGAG